MVGGRDREDPAALWAVVSRLGSDPAEESFNLENPVERLNRNRPRLEEVPPPVREALPVPP
jgi:hypothetical protein